MKQTICYCAKIEDNGRTVLSVLKQELRISASMISRLKREENGITLNGKKVYVNALIRPGDFVCASFPEETAPGGYEKCLPHVFSILYEDEYFLILDKPAGISVQPVQDPDEITLETYLREYLHCSVRPHPVSRLDKGTSGLMLVAKNAYVHELFKRMMHTNDFYKEYRAILTHCPQANEGTVSAPIGFYEGSTYARCVREDGAPSVSHYKVIERKEGLTYVSLIPETGRTHQLRVHMAYIGCPMVGDWLYGECSERIGRAALHSCFVRVRHPVTGALIETKCPLPADMKNILDP